jgi:hypothetical protein
VLCVSPGGVGLVDEVVVRADSLGRVTAALLVDERVGLPLAVSVLTVLPTFIRSKSRDSMDSALP